MIQTLGTAPIIAPFLPHARAYATPVPLESGLGGKAMPDLEHGSRYIDSRSTFDALSKLNITPGNLGVKQAKFIIMGFNKADPQLYFMNANRYDYHYDFAVTYLGLVATNNAFNSAAYYAKRRLFCLGSIVAHDSFVSSRGGTGLYTIEFWPTDRIGIDTLSKAFPLFRQQFKIADAPLAYHPAGDLQEDIWRDQTEAFVQNDIPVVTTDEIYKNIEFAPLNSGVAIGRVRFMGDGKPVTLTPRDIAVFETLPNDLTHIAGAISATPQTPLSHVNLRAIQNKTPNAYLKNASTHKGLRALSGKIARLEVTADGVDIAAASESELEAYLAQKRPKTVTKLKADNSVQAIMDLKNAGHGDYNAIGAKAANVAELYNLFGEETVPHGYAIPFYFYDQFMRENKLYEEIAARMGEVKFQSSAKARKKSLKEFRAKIKAASIDDGFYAALSVFQAGLPAGMTPRCRSSANHEDRLGFTGAGLYNSYTHREDEGHIGKSIKQVWASLWTFRAFEEREFYRIDHASAAMGVLIHENYDDERVNGVAITQNIFFPQVPGFYVNAQIGENLVTNPDANATPEELLIVQDINPVYIVTYDTIKIRSSNLVADQAYVLSERHRKKLIKRMDILHRHFKSLYLPEAWTEFAMDIEFKVTKDNRLIIKQARPW